MDLNDYRRSPSLHLHECQKYQYQKLKKWDLLAWKKIPGGTLTLGIK